jgi:hypothetical protein
MGHIAHLSHLGQYVKDFLFIYERVIQQTVGVKRYIALQSNPLSPSTCSGLDSMIDAFTVCFGSIIVTHIVYDNNVSDRPMELKIAKSMYE